MDLHTLKVAEGSIHSGKKDHPKCLYTYSNTPVATLQMNI